MAGIVHVDDDDETEQFVLISLDSLGNRVVVVVLLAKRILVLSINTHVCAVVVGPPGLP